MDRIIESQLNSFCEKFNIPIKQDKSVPFEHFINYIYFLNNLPSAYSTDREAYKKVHTGQGGDYGIDGILIVINEQAVFSLEMAKEIVQNLGNRPLDVSFYFTQAKTSDTFEIGDMLKTREGVLRFFSREKPVNKKLRSIWAIQDYIYSNSIKFATNPTCQIAYATTGIWKNNDDQKYFVSETERQLSETNIFSDVSWEAIGANKVQELYNNDSVKTTEVVEN